MRDKTALTNRLIAILLCLLGAIALAGCPAPKTEELADEPRVKTTSAVFRKAAADLNAPCNISAEFGRCGCLLDGVRTSCDLVLRCLELGFCEVEQAKPEGTKVTSRSETYSAAARSLLPHCRLPAEFGRCGCFLDGLQTSCDLVHRCLELGFCVRVAE